MHNDTTLFAGYGKNNRFFSIFMVLINWKSFAIEFQPLKLASKKYTFICAAQRVSSIKWKQCKILSKNENDDLARLFTVAYYVYCTNCTLLTVWIPIFCLIFCFVFFPLCFSLCVCVCALALVAFTKLVKVENNAKRDILTLDFTKIEILLAFFSGSFDSCKIK